MVDILLKRYLWLVQTLRERGKLTYEELASAWEHSGMNDEHSSLSQRTLYNHIMAVMKHFGVEIVCRRGRGLNQYYIANPEVFHENNMKRWLFDNFSLSNTLSEYSDISDKILLEDIPAGQQYLNVILSAIRRKRLIQFKYCNFWRAAQAVREPAAITAMHVTAGIALLIHAPHIFKHWRCQ